MALPVILRRADCDLSARFKERQWYFYSQRELFALRIKCNRSLRLEIPRPRILRGLNAAVTYPAGDRGNHALSSSLRIMVMKTHRHRTRSRACAHCGQRFVVNPRLGKRHRFCSSLDCTRASRKAARKKWLRKNGGQRYFAGNQSADRVRSWRMEHPRYWKRGRASTHSRCNGFTLTKELAATLRYVALQDTIDMRLALEIGIISQLSGAALQDTIAKEIRRLMLRGYAILRRAPT